MGSTRTRLDAGPLVAALGALLLFAALFVDWYEPGFSAFTVFEALDLVLAALALGLLVAVVGRLTGGLSVGDALLPALGGTALVVVASQLVNHPPAAVGRGLEGGAWLALGGAALALAGAVLSIARVSLDVSYRPRPGAGAAPAGAPRPEPGAPRAPGAARPAGADAPPSEARTRALDPEAVREEGSGRPGA